MLRTACGALVGAALSIAASPALAGPGTPAPVSATPEPAYTGPMLPALPSSQGPLLPVSAVEGTISIVDCNATASDVHVSVDGRPARVRGVTTPALAESPDIHVTLAAFPPSYAGACPTTFAFLGKLYAKNWSPTAQRRVDYRFVRNDGAVAPTQTASFEHVAEDVPIRNTWTLSRARYRGWQAVEVLYPRHIVFEKVPFDLACTASGAKPQLKSLPNGQAPKTMQATPGPNDVPANASPTPLP